MIYVQLFYQSKLAKLIVLFLYRKHSQKEIEAVAAAVRSILTCDFSNTPIQVLSHKFLFQRKHYQPSYVKCLDKIKAIGMSSGCTKFLGTFYPGRYYPSPEAEFCQDGIVGNLTDSMKVPLKLLDVFLRNKMTIAAVKANFVQYNKCLGIVGEAVNKKCVPALKSVCQKSAIRFIKVVRMGMEMAIHMLKYIPDLKIVHNIRDPRGITLSRSVIDRGDMIADSSGRDIVKEARIICSTMARHIRLRQALEKLRPGTSLQITYEDLATQPLEKAEVMYKFIGHNVPKEVTKWLKVNALGKSKSRNSSLIARAWEDKITLSKAKQIDGYCRTLYNQVNNRWGSV